MTSWILLLISCSAALPGFILGWVNLRRYRVAPRTGTPAPTSVSICIPARDEAENIEACIRSALAAGDRPGAPELEVLVYDDQSTDETPAILERLVAEDPRVRTVDTLPLPEGWNGKQHACERMGQAARTEWLLFTDADVRFEPEMLVRTLLARERAGVELLSTVPREITRTLGEMLLVPLINWVLLCYLPFGMMRSSLRPSASAAVGQFILCRRSAWLDSGGHAGFRDSMHDGVKMPRAFREAGHSTDLFDGTELVSCRMYRGFAETWAGFAKNAYEGLGSLGLLITVTLVHLLGQLLPWALLIRGLLAPSEQGWLIAGAALVIALPVVQRMVMARRFRQPLIGALIHPLAIVCLTAVQWWSFRLDRTGRRHWRGRVASSPAS